MDEPTHISELKTGLEELSQHLIAARGALLMAAGPYNRRGSPHRTCAAALSEAYGIITSIYRTPINALVGKPHTLQRFSSLANQGQAQFNTGFDTQLLGQTPQGTVRVKAIDALFQPSNTLAALSPTTFLPEYAAIVRQHADEASAPEHGK